MFTVVDESQYDEIEAHACKLDVTRVKFPLQHLNYFIEYVRVLLYLLYLQLRWNEYPAFGRKKQCINL